MSYEIQVVPGDGMVLITVSAGIESATAHSATREVIQLLKLHHLTRLFCDASDMKLSLSTAELYQIVELYQAEGMPYGTRIAILSAQNQPDLEKLEVFGIAALNRGYTVRIFQDRLQARKWLLHDPAKSFDSQPRTN